MCGGGNDSDSSNDSQPTGMSPGESQAKFGDTSKAGSTSPNVADYDGMSKDDYVADVLASKGYSDSYKGVKSGTTGKAVTDGKGNPVRSGSYVQAQNEADATFDAYQDYKVEKAKAQEAFYDDMEARQMVDQDIIDAAMNKGGFVMGDVTSDTFDPTNVDIGIGPPSLDNLTSYGQAVGGYADEFSFPGFSFADPYGTAMAPTVSRIDGSSLGSNITTTDEARYMENFAEGYNDDAGFLGRQIESDKAGNVGFTDAGTRFGDAVGGLVVSSLLGSIAGPVGSAIGAGLDFNNMDAYGENVPGYNARVSTTSFGAGNAIGSVLGSELGKAAAPVVGQTLYNATNNPNVAIGGAVGAGVGLGQAGNYLGGVIGDKFGMNMVSSDIGSPLDRAVDAEMEERGFGDRLNNEGSDSSSSSNMNISQLDTTPTDSQQTGDAISDQTVQDVASADIGTGDLVGQGTETEFDPNQFLMDQVAMANPNTTQVVDFFGNQGANLETNPLFMISPPGVQYLTKGRQRGFGNAIFNVQNRAENTMRSRRAGLNDSLVGTVIG